MKPVNTFELEQEILTCFNIVEDLKFYINNSDEWDEDEKQNYLIGITVKYEKRFDYTFEMFENVVKNNLL